MKLRYMNMAWWYQKKRFVRVFVYYHSTFHTTSQGVAAYTCKPKYCVLLHVVGRIV
jgi:hypothetical protein